MPRNSNPATSNNFGRYVSSVCVLLSLQPALWAQLNHVSESGSNPDERVDVSADLVVGGNANEATADLEVFGDAQVNGDLDVLGELRIDGQSPLVDGATIISNSHFYRDAYLVAEFNNFLYSLDRRYQMTPSGDFQYVSASDLSVLFDGIYDQGARIEIPEGGEFRLEIDFSTKANGSYSSRGLVQPRGLFYVSFFNSSVPSDVDLELRYQDGTVSVQGATPRGARNAVWVSEIPNKTKLQKLTVIIQGGPVVTDPTRLQELSYHLGRPRESGGFLSKYGPEELHHPLGLYDSTLNQTIELDSDTGTIRAVDLVVSGDLTTADGSLALYDEFGVEAINLDPNGNVLLTQTATEIDYVDGSGDDRTQLIQNQNEIRQTTWGNDLKTEFIQDASDGTISFIAWETDGADTGTSFQFNQFGLQITDVEISNSPVPNTIVEGDSLHISPSGIQLSNPAVLKMFPLFDNFLVTKGYVDDLFNSGSAGGGSTLVDPNDSANAVVEVTANGASVEITPVGDVQPAMTIGAGGVVRLAERQGDISMGAFGAN